MTSFVVKNEEDRRAMVGILAVNGYSVKIERITVGKTVKSVVTVWKDEEEKVKK